MIKMTEDMGDGVKFLASIGAWLLNSGWFVLFEDLMNGLISLVSLLIILVANLDKLKLQIRKLWGRKIDEGKE